MSNFYDVLDKSKVNNEIQSKGKNSFDKAAWIEKKKSEKEFAYRTIDEMTNKISHDGEMLRKYLYHQSEQNLYSVNNVMLIMAQKPIVTILKDYDGWKECGGSIKQNEEGIIILEPGAEYTREDGSTAVSFNTKKIFDVSQTVGAKLPRTRSIIGTRILTTFTPVFNNPCNFVPSNSSQELMPPFDTISKLIKDL